MHTVARISGFACLILVSLFDAGCTRATRESITVDGRERTSGLHVPSSYDGSKSIPLVLALHGRLGTGEGQERLSHMDKTSDEHGFIIVYPDGLDRSWADGRGSSPSDKKGLNDVRFLSALAAKLESKYKIDGGRVYAAGMSNGGFMSARLACDLAGKLAAVAIVAAAVPQTPPLPAIPQSLFPC